MKLREALAIERMWQEGATLSEIGRATGVNVNTVASYVDTHRGACPHRSRRVTDDDHERMRKMRRSGLTFGQIAAFTGYPVTTVRRHARDVRVERPRVP